MNQCNVIRDLLPLYLDEVCSMDSRKLVEEHLEHCKDCRREFEEMKVELHIGRVEEADEREIEAEEERLLLEGKKALEDKVRKDYQLSLGILDIVLNFGIFVWCVYASATFGYEAVTQNLLPEPGPLTGLLEAKYMLLILGFLYVFFFLWEIVYFLKNGCKIKRRILGEVIMYLLLSKVVFLVLFCIVGAVFLSSMMV